jgi:hypothetical protein
MRDSIDICQMYSQSLVANHELINTHSRILAPPGHINIAFQICRAISSCKSPLG